tara:strand:- start:8007 stop:8777 length:771 start_codon:yes stop_codon:yes gene_type:complete
MDNRKSFILHVDSLEILDDLTDEQAGKLLRSMLSFYRNESLDNLDQLTKIALKPFLNQFARDNNKWQERAERSRVNGLKGGRPKTQDNLKEPTGLSRLSEKPKEPVSVNDNVNVNVNDNVNVNVTLKDKEPCQAIAMTKPQKITQAQTIFDYWVNVMKKNPATSKLTTKRNKMINDRLKERYTLEMIMRAIDGCSKDAFSMGDNDRNKPFNDIELICRTGEKLESFYSVTENKQNNLKGLSLKNYNNMKDIDLDQL